LRNRTRNRLGDDNLDDAAVVKMNANGKSLTREECEAILNKWLEKPHNFLQYCERDVRKHGEKEKGNEKDEEGEVVTGGLEKEREVEVEETKGKVRINAVWKDWTEEERLEEEQAVKKEAEWSGVRRSDKEAVKKTVNTFHFASQHHAPKGEGVKKKRKRERAEVEKIVKEEEEEYELDDTCYQEGQGGEAAVGNIEVYHRPPRKKAGVHCLLYTSVN
jgi:hypothetical protein